MRHILLSFIASLALAGCMSEDVLHYDGVTTAAGDAIAANTAMQMIDPWPAGVEQTRFTTPAVRPEPPAADAGGADASADIAGAAY